MPKDTTIKSVLVIGSGPIIIGQAAEFDYAGTQACIALKEEGYKVILVNNNPATIMTDEMFADSVYFEPLTADTLEKIIKKERPDGILATLGGQVGLNLATELHKNGVLERYKVKVLGTTIESIHKGEDREAFRDLMYKLREPVPASKIIYSKEEAKKFIEEVGLPVIVRPAYTLGGTGGGIAETVTDLEVLVENGLQESPIQQILIEKSIAGFKEVEYEVMRDAANTCITICNMENIDPVGIHTGDSIVVAPSQTLTDDEHQMLRTASIKIISALEIVGGCNIQFALDPLSKRYYLIEVNPRVSRSSALASKATGYPIARIAAKLAVGYLLSELKNPVTGTTFASFEPALDYVVVKFPQWPFDKFPTVDRRLGTQMKATGETMGIDRCLERALLKAIRSLDHDCNDLQVDSFSTHSKEELMFLLSQQTDQRFFVITELLRRGMSIEELHDYTKIDLFFLLSFKNLIEIEDIIASNSIKSVSLKQLQLFKEKGFSDKFLASKWGVSEKEVRHKRKTVGVKPSFKMVDTCAGEFESVSNYFYSTYFGENEVELVQSTKRKILIVGSGPNRIGQGIEFDYCSVHGVFALKGEGIETVMINSNPETVSTDYTIADRLYFEPLVLEDVLNVIENENINEVYIQVGGQTALNLAKALEEYGITLLGTSSEIIDCLEDRDRFYHLLEELNIPHVQGVIAHNLEELLLSAKKIGYPILLRPSYVIGGKGMEIIGSKSEMFQFISKRQIHYPILVDKYMNACEAELDLAADGNYILAPLIIEHIERTGVHSGDSISIIPAKNLSLNVKEKMIQYASKIVKKLNYRGIMNIQFIIEDELVYVLEVNPRASRTVPLVSKVTGIPLIEIASKILLNRFYLTKEDEVLSIQADYPYVCIKYPVFSTFALSGLDPKLGPEMKSTGEGIAIAGTFEQALNKSFYRTSNKGNKIIYPAGEDLSDIWNLATSFGVEFIPAKEMKNSPLFDEVAGVYFPGKSSNDEQFRSIAARKRVPIFTEKETVIAYLVGRQASDWSVNSIQDWLEKKQKDVAVT